MTYLLENMGFLTTFSDSKGKNLKINRVLFKRKVKKRNYDDLRPKISHILRKGLFKNQIFL